MKLENSIFEEDYITSFTQTGIHSVLTNKSFLSLMEIQAGAHSAYCHHSFSDLAKNDLSWILLSWKLKVYKRPKADEKIKVETWGREKNKIFVMRDFRITNENKEVLAIATSKWCLIDKKIGKIAKMPEDIDKIYHGFREENVFNEPYSDKISIPQTEPKFIDTYKVRRFDLDINKHVHNLNYLNFAYEVLPFDVFMGEELNNIEIVYKREIRYGDTIKSFLYEENRNLYNSNKK